MYCSLVVEAGLIFTTQRYNLKIDKSMFMLEINVEFKLADGVVKINDAYAPWCEFDSHLSSPLTTNYLTH